MIFCKNMKAKDYENKSIANSRIKVFHVLSKGNCISLISLEYLF